MEMQVIFVINFMDKAIGQCKPGKLWEMFWNMKNKDHGVRDPRAQIEKWQPK